MTAGADGRYGYRAWDRRPGDDVDPSVLLTPEEVLNAFPTAPSMGGTVNQEMITQGISQRRFLGMPRTQPGIGDVLAAASRAPLMRDTPTRQDSGQPGTMGPANNAW